MTGKFSDEAVDFVARKIAPAAFDQALPVRVAESWQREARIKASDILSHLASIDWRTS